MMDEYLTQDEVDALPENTPVIVAWSGGNGPHRYFIHSRYGRAYASLGGPPADTYSRPLTFVGPDSCQTRVRRA
jgi:hypothetical protein